MLNHQTENGYLWQLPLSSFEFINKKLTEQGYIAHRHGTNKLVVLDGNDIVNLLPQVILNQTELEQIKVDYENGVCYFFTESVDIAEKYESLFTAIDDQVNTDLIIERIAEQADFLYTENRLIAKLNEQVEFTFDGKRVSEHEMLDFANYCSNNNKHLDSLFAYNNYLLSNPDNQQLSYNVGCLLSRFNLDNHAIDYYNKVTDKTIEVNHNKALSYSKVGNYHLALEHAVEAIKSGVDKSYLLAGQVAIKQQDYQLATKILNSGFIKLKHSNPVEANKISKQFHRLNKYLNQQ